MVVAEPVPPTGFIHCAIEILLPFSTGAHVRAMSDAPGFELLEQFARNQSEAAFAELVERQLLPFFAERFEGRAVHKEAVSVLHFN